MKKMFTTIATWIKSLFAKPKHINQVKNEMTIEEKKQIISEFNNNRNKCDGLAKSISDLNDKKHENEQTLTSTQKSDHKEILKVTVRSKKPFKYEKSKNVEFSTPLGIILLTKKQSFFLNTIQTLQHSEFGINSNVVCEIFMSEKFKNSPNSLNEKNTKYDYHKTTFKYLIKQGLIEKVSKGHYKTSY